MWGIVRELASSRLFTLGDKGYHGAGEHVITPYKGRNKPASQKAANRAHAKLRAPGERANAQLKTWRILRKRGIAECHRKLALPLVAVMEARASALLVAGWRPMP